MNINNFKEKIDQTILKRGYNYFIEENIIESYKQDENVYSFIVQGSEEYEVVARIGDDGEILFSSCECPL